MGSKVEATIVADEKICVEGRVVSSSVAFSEETIVFTILSKKEPEIPPENSLKYVTFVASVGKREILAVSRQISNLRLTPVGGSTYVIRIWGKNIPLDKSMLPYLEVTP